ncbi:HNH endonuclease [Ensifer sp. ENS07]|uniref:HNH endonuclease n=1 Tax=Ensifer sp. ENS07 TaxID=2769274 RepID=UPI001780DC1A|nr:HNH endonuclease signature motif containing protein [Ensifer sp. ENS07]MBD9636096.1 HNH endonuclease [Ensifer sp. ENS07]
MTEEQRKRESRVPSSARDAWHHLYDTALWKRLRLHQLAQEPLCRFCLLVEDVTEATVVDHVQAHKGSIELFSDPANLQSLCKPCHDSLKQRIDRGTKVAITGVDGYPIEVG